MYGFQNEDFLKTLNGAVSRIDEINKIADKVSDLGYKNIYLVGTGGTYAIISPLAYMLKTNSTLIWYHEIAAELLAAKGEVTIVGCGTGGRDSGGEQVLWKYGSQNPEDSQKQNTENSCQISCWKLR